MMAKALAVNGAAKVYVLGRRLDKLQEVANSGVRSGVSPQSHSDSSGRGSCRVCDG